MLTRSPSRSDRVWGPMEWVYFVFRGGSHTVGRVVYTCWWGREGRGWGLRKSRSCRRAPFLGLAQSTTYFLRLCARLGCCVSPSSCTHNRDKRQLLYKLPGTVRGVGLELIGSFDLSVLDGKKGVDGFPGICDRRQDMANLIGYIAVVRGGVRDHSSRRLKDRSRQDMRTPRSCYFPSERVLLQ